MKYVTYTGKIEQRLIILDAVMEHGKINKPFDSVTIMRYIAENEIHGQTFDHHDIGFEIDALETKGIVKRSTACISEFTTYEVNH